MVFEKCWMVRLRQTMWMVAVAEYYVFRLLAGLQAHCLHSGLVGSLVPSGQSPPSYSWKNSQDLVNIATVTKLLPASKKKKNCFQLVHISIYNNMHTHNVGCKKKQWQPSVLSHILYKIYNYLILECVL